MKITLKDKLVKPSLYSGGWISVFSDAEGEGCFYDRVKII